MYLKLIKNYYKTILSHVNRLYLNFRWIQREMKLFVVPNFELDFSLQIFTKG